MIPISALFDQSPLTTLLAVDPLVADYRAFFAELECGQSYSAGKRTVRPAVVRTAIP